MDALLEALMFLRERIAIAMSHVQRGDLHAAADELESARDHLEQITSTEEGAAA